MTYCSPKTGLIDFLTLTLKIFTSDEVREDRGDPGTRYSLTGEKTKLELERGLEERDRTTEKGSRMTIRVRRGFDTREGKKRILVKSFFIKSEPRG